MIEFDKLVHQPTRLQVFAYLYSNGETTFSELIDELDLTEGNLSTHINRMEEADAIVVNKEFVDRKPQTTYRLTEMGREAFETHLDTLELFISKLQE